MMKIILTCSILLAIPTFAKNDKLANKGDSQTYETVEIGNQVWMAKNMNVKTEGSWCYDNKPSNCKKYGRLYSREAALNVCPSGWHLPNKEDFETLLSEVGDMKTAGKILKSREGWNGSDDLGFGILPAGYASDNGTSFTREGSETAIWSSSIQKGNKWDGDRNVVLGFTDGDEVYLGGDDPLHYFPVRCLKD